MKKWPRFSFKKAIILIPIFLGIFSLWLSFQPQEIKTKTIVIESSPSPIVISTKEPIGTQKPKATPTPQPTSKPTPSPIVIPASESPVKKIQVSLSVNGQKLDLSIDEGKNQCEVLSEALSQGKISSLNMRYDENYKTYAVYQINGIGKENDVWWTYSVNDHFPSQGCSFIKANNGDKIAWKYIGS